MTQKEIRLKIQDLLDSGQGENTYIGVYLKINELGLTLEEALAELEPIEYKIDYKHENDYCCSIRIADVWIEYEHLDGYIPYLGTEASTSRVVSYYRKGRQESIEGLSVFLSTEDDDKLEAIKAIIKADYISLIPNIVLLLKN